MIHTTCRLRVCFCIQYVLPKNRNTPYVRSAAPKLLHANSHFLQAVAHSAGTSTDTGRGRGSGSGSGRGSGSCTCGPALLETSLQHARPAHSVSRCCRPIGIPGAVWSTPRLGLRPMSGWTANLSIGTLRHGGRKGRFFISEWTTAHFGAMGRGSQHGGSMSRQARRQRTSARNFTFRAENTKNKLPLQSKDH